MIRKPPGRIDGGARGTESHGTEQKTAGAHGAVRLTATPMPCAAGERGPAVEEEETPAPTASWRWAERKHGSDSEWGAQRKGTSRGRERI